MKYRRLGSSDLLVSEIGFGCGAASGKGLFVSDDTALQNATIGRALELGITYFDTAPIYGDGRSEIALGRALRTFDATKAKVATKIALTPDQLDDIPTAIKASVEGSLKRLDRDAADVVFLHNRIAGKRASSSRRGPGALLSVEDVLGPRGVVAGLESLRKRGLVRHFGYCAFGGEADAVDAVTASHRFDAIMIHYNLVNQSAFRAEATDASLDNYEAVAARAAANGVGAVVLRVLEAGTLADNAREVGTANTALYEGKSNRYDFLRNDDGQLAEAAIRFALSEPGVSVVLVGIAATSHVDTAARASALGPLSAEQLERIEAVRSQPMYG